MKPTVGEYYRHYKGGLYKIISLAVHSETLEEMVVYYNVDHKSTWVRPLSIWNEPTKDGQTRFTLLVNFIP